jgi:DNA-binding transcriptional regulator YiaG
VKRNGSIQDPGDLALAILGRRTVAEGNLRTIREELRVTQAEIAAACGVAQSTEAGWESGRSAPSGRRAVRLGRVLTDLREMSTDG